MASNVTGGRKLGQYLKRHARQVQRAGPVDVGVFDPVNASKALRQEFGAEGADGQVTPETAFMRKAAGLGARQDLRRAVRSGAKGGNLAAGLMAAGRVLQRGMKRNITEDDLIESGKMRRAVKVRKGG